MWILSSGGVCRSLWDDGMGMDLLLLSWCHLRGWLDGGDVGAWRGWC